MIIFNTIWFAVTIKYNLDGMSVLKFSKFSFLRKQILRFNYSYRILQVNLVHEKKWWKKCCISLLFRIFFFIKIVFLIFWNAYFGRWCTNLQICFIFYVLYVFVDDKKSRKSQNNQQNKKGRFSNFQNRRNQQVNKKGK